MCVCDTVTHQLVVRLIAALGLCGRDQESLALILLEIHFVFISYIV